jgi:arylformamidase
MKKCYDISLLLNQKTLKYPGDDGIEIIPVSNFDNSNLLTNKVLLHCHLGTHVDSPSHFRSDGLSLDKYPIKNFYGEAIVVDQCGKKVIDAEDVKETILPAQHHILFKTDNSKLLSLDNFSETYTHLTIEAAEYICSLNPLSFGFDYYSVDSFNDSSLPVHNVFAKHQIPVYVCLNLSEIKPKNYIFSGLPIKIENIEAYPVHAILVEKE